MASHSNYNAQISKASVYSIGGSYRSVQTKTKIKPEPFEEIPLKGTKKKYLYKCMI